MQNFINREPAILTAVVLALINVAVAFGVPISEETKATIVPVAVSLLILVAGLVIRSQVTPVKK